MGEWVFPTNNKNDLSSIQRQIGSIEQELTYLQKLKHPNLGLYYGMKYNTEDDFLIVNLLREFIQG